MAASRVIFGMIMAGIFIFGLLRVYRRGYFTATFNKYAKEEDKYHLYRSENPGQFWSIFVALAAVTMVLIGGTIWLIFNPDFEPCQTWPKYFRCRA
jgi:hypothetical protein